MIIVKATKDSEAGVMPSQQLLTEMGKFNEELAQAGVLLAGEGLHPTSKGARVRFSGGQHTVIDGPFAEIKELIAGYWLWQCKSMQEAIDWVKRCPNPYNEDGEVEIRHCSRRKISAGNLRRNCASRKPAFALKHSVLAKFDLSAPRRCCLPV
jgi:hypothetical protein